MVQTECPWVADPSYLPVAWASAHRGKWGQLTPWKNRRKIILIIKKRKHAKEQFSEWGWVKAGVENGAMLTTCLFIYTPECTVS